MAKTILIEGMTCNNCVRHVEEALKELSGVASVKVDLKDKKAMIETTQDVSDQAIRIAIDEAGYNVLQIQ